MRSDVSSNLSVFLQGKVSAQCAGGDASAVLEADGEGAGLAELRGLCNAGGRWARSFGKELAYALQQPARAGGRPLADLSTTN